MGIFTLYLYVCSLPIWLSTLGNNHNKQLNLNWTQEQKDLLYWNSKKLCLSCTRENYLFPSCINLFYCFEKGFLLIHLKWHSIITTLRVDELLHKNRTTREIQQGSFSSHVSWWCDAASLLLYLLLCVLSRVSQGDWRNPLLSVPLGSEIKGPCATNV